MYPSSFLSRPKLLMKFTSYTCEVCTVARIILGAIYSRMPVLFNYAVCIKLF
jgi:hypothetical protein